MNVVFILFFIFLITLFFLIRQNRLKNKIEILNRTLVEKINLATLDLRRAQQLSKVGSWRYKIEEDFLEWSDETYNIFQIDKVKTPIKSLDDFALKVDPVYVKVVHQEYNKHLKDATPYDISHELILEDGTSKWIREKCETSYDEQGTPIVSNGVLHDITEQVLMEQDMKAKDKHMFYQSRLAQMGEMISMIAHQWRQPLAAIAATTIDLKMKMELEIYDLEKKEDRDSYKDYLNSKLDNIEDFTQSLTATIDDFRDFYKPNKVFTLVDINEPIQKTLNILRASLSTNNIALIENYNTDKKLSLLEREIMQVLLNIFKNAQDNFIYKDISDAAISIETQDTDEGVRLNICDNGGGIPEDIILKIFDPYFSTKYDKNGTGLGLYMSKIIIQEHHGGKLYIENRNGGACFSIELKEKNYL